MHDTHRTHGARLWTRLCFVALTVVFLGSLGTAIVAAQAKPSGKTVWDGVYTDAQAERATATFSSTCSRCHTLGADGNRPLSGDKFWEGYTQKTVADLLAFVSKNMPNGQGGTLSPGTYNDLVALILKTNGFPAGTTEVTPETVTGVQIIPKDGPGELPANTLVRIVGCLAPKSGSDWTLTNATDPERIDKTTVGARGCHAPAGFADDGLEVRAQSAGSARREANVGDRADRWVKAARTASMSRRSTGLAKPVPK